MQQQSQVPVQPQVLAQAQVPMKQQAQVPS